MNWRYETTDDKLARLRSALAEAQEELISAEARLADLLAEVHAFEHEFEAEVGHLVDELAAVERELNGYKEQIRRVRNERHFGSGYESVDEQYQRTWHVPPADSPKRPAEPVPTATEAQIKKLYRQLARRFHPDLADDETDRAYRTDKMRLINDAYAARSMVELQALAAEMAKEPTPISRRSGKTDNEMIEVLANELARCQRRLREIEMESRNLHNRPSVAISLEIKLARRQGSDYLAQMKANLERKIGRKSAERDMIKAQFDSINRDDQGFKRTEGS